MAPVLGPLVDRLAGLNGRSDDPRSGRLRVRSWVGTATWTRTCGCSSAVPCRARSRAGTAAAACSRPAAKRSGPRSTRPREARGRPGAAPSTWRADATRRADPVHLRRPAGHDALDEPPDVPAGRVVRKSSRAIATLGVVRSGISWRRARRPCRPRFSLRAPSPSPPPRAGLQRPSCCAASTALRQVMPDGERRADLHRVRIRCVRVGSREPALAGRARARRLGGRVRRALGRARDRLRRGCARPAVRLGRDSAARGCPLRVSRRAAPRSSSSCTRRRRPGSSPTSRRSRRSRPSSGGAERRRRRVQPRRGAARDRRVGPRRRRRRLAEGAHDPARALARDGLAGGVGAVRERRPLPRFYFDWDAHARVARDRDDARSRPPSPSSPRSTPRSGCCSRKGSRPPSHATLRSGGLPRGREGDGPRAVLARRGALGGRDRDPDARRGRRAGARARAAGPLRHHGRRGHGELGARMFRIGHIGYYDVFDITTALAAVELLLVEAARRSSAGVAMSRALEAYREAVRV